MKWTQKKLSDGHQHCEEILQQRLEKSRLGDPAGNLARAMSQDHRCLAITGYMLDYDIDAFRKHLSASAKGQLELWNRKQNGEEIFHHFVNVCSYRYLFDALAAGDFRLATALARFMEGPVRNDFDNYIGFNLKYLVLEDYQRALAVAAQYSFDKWKDEYRGYHRAIAFISNRTGTDAEFNEVMDRLDRLHRRRSRRIGGFKDTEEELLSIWGIGFANLAVHQGAVSGVTFDCEVMPNKLIIRGK
jgi:hypothetical protein